MSYIYLVTRKDGFPITSFTRKYMCKNFLSFKQLGNSDVNLYSMCEGKVEGQVGEPKKVDAEFFTRGK